MADFIEEHREVSTRQDQHEVLTSSRAGLVRQREYFDNDRIAERDNVGFNVIPPEHITYRSRSDNRRFYFNFNDLNITGIISIYYPVFRIRNGANGFFLNLFSARSQYIGRFSVGTSQTVLSLNELRRIKLAVPEADEQKKIADFLGAVDERISLLQRRRDALARYKTGMMQRLFDQSLRFTRDDGTAFPDWAEKRLGELGELMGGGTPDTNAEEFWGGETPWVSSSDLDEHSIHEINLERKINSVAIASSATKLIPAGSILIVTRVGIGKVAIAPTELCTSQDFSNLVVEQDDVVFLAYWLSFNRNRLRALAQGTSIKGITTVDLKLLRVALPHTDEQRQIANALCALDDKIAAVSAQADLMQAFKKGLLQQMFV